jgi:hypothetical protein
VEEVEDQEDHQGEAAGLEGGEGLEDLFYPEGAEEVVDLRLAAVEVLLVLLVSDQREYKT